MSSVALNPNLDTLPVYIPGKPIEEVAREVGLEAASIVKLASNENPLGPSPKALAAMAKALHSLHLYPDGNAFYLKRKLTEKLGVEPANLILGNGSNEIIEFIGHAALQPGDEVLTSQYCFAVYPIVTALFGAKLVTVPAQNLGSDIPALLQALTPRTKVLFLANPNNPTGTLTSPADLETLLAAVPPNVLVALDEAYVEFLDEPFDALALIRSGKHPNLMLLRTFSKIFGLAGLRLGYGIGAPALISALEKVRQPFNLNSIAQAGALAALDDEEHLVATRENNRQGRDFLQAAFTRMGLEFVPSHANFVLVKVGDGGRLFAELQRRGLITRPMASYQLSEWLRISIGTPAENQRLVQTLGEVLGKVG
jgi:histidinol-phosphate aminotransferase